jgi:hypothetical protein
MLFAFFPLYVLDGMLEMYAASLHACQKEPVVILMEEDPSEAALAA